MDIETRMRSILVRGQPLRMDSRAGALVEALKDPGSAKYLRTNRKKFRGLQQVVNALDGEVLVWAAGHYEFLVIEVLLTANPSSKALSSAFRKLFANRTLGHENLLKAIRSFAEAPEAKLNPNETSNDARHVLFEVLNIVPHHEVETVIRSLLAIGLSPISAKTVSQAGLSRHDEVATRDNKYDSSLLCEAVWRKSAVAFIKLLVDNGGLNAFAIATHHQLWDAFPALVGGVTDIASEDRGNVPALERLVRLKDSSPGALRAVECLIAAGAHNDRSLHEACIKLDVNVVKALLAGGFDPNFLSHFDQHQTALARLCRSNKIGGSEQNYKKVITLLREAGANVHAKTNGRPPIFLCLSHNSDSLALASLFLEVFGHDAIANESSICTIKGHVYSATMFVTKGLSAVRDTEQADVLSLLRNAGCPDRYYKLDGPQPADAVGLPPTLAAIKAGRQARKRRIDDENADHAQKLARVRETNEEELRGLREVHALRLAQAAELRALEDRGPPHYGFTRDD